MTEKQIYARYIGSGCYIREDGALAFVNAANREGHELMVGRWYELAGAHVDGATIYTIVTELVEVVG